MALDFGSVLSLGSFFFLGGGGGGGGGDERDAVGGAKRKDGEGTFVGGSGVEGEDATTFVPFFFRSFVFSCLTSTEGSRIDSRSARKSCSSEEDGRVSFVSSSLTSPSTTEGSTANSEGDACSTEEGGRVDCRRGEGSSGFVEVGEVEVERKSKATWNEESSLAGGMASRRGRGPSADLGRGVGLGGGGGEGGRGDVVGADAKGERDDRGDVDGVGGDDTGGGDEGEVEDATTVGGVGSVAHSTTKS